MSRQDSLGDRMKGYEKISSVQLMKRTPVIIRLDGKAFHTYTRGMDKPYDEDLHTVRSNTMQYLVENIQGCIMGYSQSDEISLILKDWQTYNTSAWFDNKLQKLVSVSASMCTAQWNIQGNIIDNQAWMEINDLESEVATSHKDKFSGMATFDARAFNLPKEEVVNYLIWRQNDWERNSVQMLGQSLYSHKELQGKSCKEIIPMVEQDHGIIWGELEPWKKQGEFYVKSDKCYIARRFKDIRESLDKIIMEEDNE